MKYFTTVLVLFITLTSFSAFAEKEKLRNCDPDAISRALHAHFKKPLEKFAKKHGRWNGHLAFDFSIYRTGSVKNVKIVEDTVYNLAPRKWALKTFESLRNIPNNSSYICDVKGWKINFR